MQYLSSRQEIIKYLYSEKKKHAKEKIKVEAENGTNVDFKDTLVLEHTLFEALPHGGRNGDLERMPKGEAISLSSSQGKEFEILLSKHKCKLLIGDNIQFVDPDGRNYTLNISRLHLVIEIDPENKLQLTDMSAHGTFMAARFLENQTV
jgi:hypothetical protein